jgi:hypothetical protein
MMGGLVLILEWGKEYLHHANLIFTDQNSVQQGVKGASLQRICVDHMPGVLLATRTAGQICPHECTHRIRKQASQVGAICY